MLMRKVLHYILKTVAGVAALLSFVALPGCGKVDDSSFNFEIETPSTAPRRHHVSKDCVISIFISQGPTQSFDVASELFVLDSTSGEYVAASSTYDLPNGEGLYLGRHYECFFKGAPKGNYKAVVTLSARGRSLTREYEFRIRKDSSADAAE